MIAYFRRNFTLHRWALNPFQMYGVSFLLAVAIAQLALGATPGSIQEELEINTLLALATCNTIGAVIAMVGLHTKELEEALWVELCGYLCLIFVLGFYVIMLIGNRVSIQASYGFGLSEAFVYAAIHRSGQILLYKRANKKRRDLAREAEVLKRAFPPGTDGFPPGWDDDDE